MNGVFRLFEKGTVNYIANVCGVLTISVQNKLTPKEETALEEFLYSNGIKTYDMQLKQTPVACQEIKVGSKLENADYHGTLGGFVRRQPSENNERVSGLTAYHVAQHIFPQFLVDGHNIQLLNLLTTHDFDNVDIAAFDIEESMNIQIDASFRDRHGQVYPSEVFHWSPQNTPFRFPVFKRGAVTGLTLGSAVTSTLGSHAIRYEHDGENRILENVFLIDGESDRPFLEPGDSGSLVCRKNPNDATIKVIAILIAKQNNDGFAQRLDYCLTSMMENGHGNFSMYNPPSDAQ